MYDADSATLFDVMDYLYWANMSELELTFTLTDNDLKWINSSVNSYVWRDHIADSELWALPSYQFLNQLEEFTRVVSGSDFRTMPYFMEYFDGPVFPKFIFYSAHSESVYPFLQSLIYPV
jgi:hypothetical protein